MVNKWIFKPKDSNGLTGDEIVTVFHPGEYSIQWQKNNFRF